MLNSSPACERYGSKFKILSWVHSHVRGAPLGFSSIDVHTQFAYGQMFKEMFGLVIEFHSKESYLFDFFTLSMEGIAHVGHCSRSQNLSSLQHGGCSGRNLYESIRSRIQPTDDSLNTIDARFGLPFNAESLLDPIPGPSGFSSVYESPANVNSTSMTSLPSINFPGNISMTSLGTISMASLDPEMMEIDKTSTTSSQKASMTSLLSINQDTIPSEEVNCQGCKKIFATEAIFVQHISRAKKCKEVFGIERYKQLQEKRRRKSKGKYNATNREEIKAKQKVYNDENKEEMKLKQRSYNKEKKEEKKLKQKAYNEQNKEELKLKQRAYNEQNKEELKLKQRAYNEQNKEELKLKQRAYNKQNKEELKLKQREYNEQNKEELKLKQRVYNEQNKEEMKLKHKQYNIENRTENRKRHEEYNREHQQDIQIKQKKKREETKNSQTKQNRLIKFRNAIKLGPIYPCICCHRTCFITGVKEIQLDTLRDKIGELFDQSITITQTFCISGRYYLCHNCHLLLIKKKRKPGICSMNGLSLDKRYPELELTELEQQLIAKNLLFMKIKKLPRSRMGAIIDRVINVPLQDDDIEKTAASLPRTLDDSGLVTVKLKRMRALKNVHNEALIRPTKVLQALSKLKELGNPHYLTVETNINFAEESLAQDEMAWTRLTAITEHDTDQEPTEDETDDEQEEQEEAENAIQEFQVHDGLGTCMVPENPETAVVFNNSNETINVKINATSKPVEVAPGEGKIPTNWLRDDEFDVKAFPTLHPTGKYGLNHEPRDPKISTQQYFMQRLLNIDQRFCQDDSYLFAAQQRVEREMLEKQLDIVFQRGKLSKGVDGIKVLQVKDPFIAFQKVRGSPKYWQTVRNELLVSPLILVKYFI